MDTLARWCFRKRWVVIASWVILLVALGGIAQAVGSSYSTNFSSPLKADSTKALNIEKSAFKSQAGDTEEIVFQSHGTPLLAPSAQAQVGKVLANVSKLPFVEKGPQGIVSPYLDPAQAISKDGTIGFARVQLTILATSVTSEQGKALVSAAQQYQSKSLNVQLSGAAAENASQAGGKGNGGGGGLLYGIIAALVVLFFAFRRSILSSLLPLISALLAIGVGTSFIAFLTHTIEVPSFASQLAELIALGVGVDYALFVVSRHRRELLNGRSPEDAAVTALNTAGRAVLVAGITVCIALLGMFALGMSFLYGVAVSASIVVLFTMLASITVLPAMLGFYGFKALNRSERRQLEKDNATRESGGTVADQPGFWVRWSEIVTQRSPIFALVAGALIVVIALPIFHMRLGLADASEDPASSTTGQSYQLLTKGFGAGYTQPISVVGRTATPEQQGTYKAFVAGLDRVPGIAKVTPSFSNPEGTATITEVFSADSPQSAQTEKLVNNIRKVVPAGADIHVGGQTASGIDFSNILGSKMPYFVGIVIILAFIVLAAVFRSLLVPLVASVMNLLSIGGALGVMVAAFQYGWGKPILGFASAGPIESFLPVMVFSIVFGLSMDYEVFLVSRMHEEWVQSRDNTEAVRKGLAETGRVVTAAAIIMIMVFGSFALAGSQLVIQEIAIGFAGAIFIDAFIVRTALVPAVMHLLGKSNWWLPGWLDRLLPTLHIEAEDLEPVSGQTPPPEPVGAGEI